MQSQWARLLALVACSPLAHALSVPQPNAVKQASVQNGGLNTEGVETLDGVPLDAIPEGRSAPAPGAQEFKMAPAAGSPGTASADSYQPENPPSNVLDGNTNTIWHTQFNPTIAQLPHYLQIDMGSNQLINSIAYQPRQDGNSNGNIGGHTIQVSLDGRNWNTVAYGTWMDDASTKTTIFEAQTARYVRLNALTEAGGRGPWSSCAEFKIFTTNTPAPGYQGIGGGQWSPTIDFPLVPVSVALEFNYNQGGGPAGTILAWSSYSASTFGGSSGLSTITASFNPTNYVVSQRTVTETGHDMFCEGLTLDPQGRIFSTGGNSAAKFSIFTPGTQKWSSGPNMNIQRGYHAMAQMSDGRTFTIGGSWSGGTGGKNGEVYSPATNQWKAYSNLPVKPMLTADAQGEYRADNHAWLFGWKNGYIFQAGPSKQMNWYYPDGNGGNGQVIGVGNRGNDGDAMCGNAVMYDAVAGKILAVGGATSYQNVDATANANIITLGNAGGAVQVQGINRMWYQRIFANGVVMPNGNVFIVGGQVHGQPFSDDTSILVAEVWVQATTNFIKTPPISIPRNYHSTAILLADGAIFVGGGGLCGSCATNHYDAQIYRPGYLYDNNGNRAVRPVINTVNGDGNTATVHRGGQIVANTNGGIASWSLVRMSVTTHTVNTDQRRVPLTATQNGNTYTMTLPNDPGILIPGPWLLFAMSASGTPSYAKYILTT